MTNKLIYLYIKVACVLMLMVFLFLKNVLTGEQRVSKSENEAVSRETNPLQN